MEMSFPHQALRQSTESKADGQGQVLDAARARQAQSQTVRALQRATDGDINKIDDLAARIHCFTVDPSTEMAVRGSFWQAIDARQIDEPPVYQSSSANIKQQVLSRSDTGNESKLTGHGAEKKS